MSHRHHTPHDHFESVFMKFPPDPMAGLGWRLNILLFIASMCIIYRPFRIFISPLLSHGAAFCYQAKAGAIINIDYFRFARIRPSVFHIVEDWTGPIDPSYHQVVFLKF